MPAVLTTASTLLCPHGGQIVAEPSQTLLTVDGRPVLLRADLLGPVLIGCPLKPPATPCVKILSITDGVATTLRVGTEPAVLETARGATNVQPGWLVSAAGQTKLEAV